MAPTLTGSANNAITASEGDTAQDRMTQCDST